MGLERVRTLMIPVEDGLSDRGAPCVQLAAKNSSSWKVFLSEGDASFTDCG